MTTQPGSPTKGRRGVAIAAAAAGVVVVIALIALIVSLVSSSSFEDPDELRSAMADAGYPCEPEAPSSDRGQWSGQLCDLEDGGRVGLRVYESGDPFDEYLANLRGQPRPLVYGDNWSIEAFFSPRDAANRDLISKMAERLDAETANLDL
ncbi:MAG: hypothetical protein ACRDJS_02255 [Actinomycetota bacterium]